MFGKLAGSDSARGRMWLLVRPFVLAALPVPDLAARRRVRRLARSLVHADPWPGLAATSEQAAELAILRLCSLQVCTRRAVRSRQPEAAVMLARVSIETLITGLYCRYEPSAIGRLQAENVRNLPLLLKFLTDAGILPAEVLDECLRGLGNGEPARGPTVAAMASAVDRSLNARAALDLYDRFYRPSSAYSVHGGGLALLRHVGEDGRLTRRPQRTWARRSPVRIADFCVGALTANMARRAGTPSRLADAYTERHLSRTLTPMVAMSSPGFTTILAPRNLRIAITTFKDTFRYAASGHDAADPAKRVARIREGMRTLLVTGQPGLPDGALDPFLDFISDKIASETLPEATTPAQAARQTG
jgi:hypothetical protein